MIFKDRIIRFIKHEGISIREFERRCGFSNGYLNKVKDLTVDKIKEIIHVYPQLNEVWVLTGETGMLNSKTTPCPETDPTDNNSITERIRQILKEEDISIASFSKSVGLIQTTVNRQIKGDSQLSAETIEAFLHYFKDISSEWLLRGKGGKYKSYDNVILNTLQDGMIPIHKKRGELLEVIESENNNPQIDTYSLTKNYDPSINNTSLTKNLSETRPRIPYTAAAGTLTSAVEGVTPDQCEQIPRIVAFPNYDFTIIIKGNSMEPKYEGGDEVACKRVDNTSFIQWGKVHVMDTAQGIIIKRVYEDGEKIRCASYNPEYPDFSICKDEIYSMSLVVGLLRL